MELFVTYKKGVTSANLVDDDSYIIFSKVEKGISQDERDKSKLRLIKAGVLASETLAYGKPLKIALKGEYIRRWITGISDTLPDEFFEEIAEVVKALDNFSGVWEVEHRSYLPHQVVEQEEKVGNVMELMKGLVEDEE